MAKVNLLVFVEEDRLGDKIKEVKVDFHGMEIIMFLPKSGIILGVVDEEKLPEIAALEGVAFILTDEQLKQELLCQPAKQS